MPSRPSRPPATRRGFALLVTIVLVAFLVLILVGLASFTRVETQVADNAQSIAKARQNALLALNLALGQLQQAAGPDQRVTARAEILDSSPDTPAIDNVTQPFWTGVWMTHNPGGNNQLDVGSENLRSWSTSNPNGNDSRVTWLVSGTQTPTPALAVDNSSINPMGWAANVTGANPNAVELARNLGPNGNINVAVPLVDITAPTATIPGQSGPGDTTIGKYAYWVSDEGVKAKVNLTDPTFGSSNVAQNQLHHWVPQANAMHLTLPMDSGSADFRAVVPGTDLVNLISAQSLAFLPALQFDNPSNPPALSRHLLDVTVHSRGVLADVRNGGLKKDLTAAFESPTNFLSIANNSTFGGGNGGGFLYRVGTGAPNFSTPDGLPWHTLYFHYNSYKATIPPPVATSGGAASPTGIANPANALPHTVSMRVNSVDRDGVTTKMGGLVPVLLASRLDVAVGSYLDGSTWRLRIHYYPQIVLYNPYSVAISFPNYQFSRNFNAFSSNQLSGSVTPDAGGSPISIAAFNINTGSVRLTLRTQAGDSDVLAPGEIRVFALTTDHRRNNLADAINFNTNFLRSTSNASADFFQWADIPGYTGTTNPNDRVTLTINNRNFGANAFDTFAFPNTIKWPNSDGNNRIMNHGAIPGVAAGATGSISNVTISSLTTPRRIIGVFLRRKGLQNHNNTGAFNNYSSGADALPIFHGNDGSISIYEDSTSAQWQEVFLPAFGSNQSSSASEIQIHTNNPNPQTFWGFASTGVQAPQDTSPRRKVLRDVPTQPLVSLGQFMHMPAYAFVNTGNFQIFSPGTMFVGGSYCSPIIPTNGVNISTINRLFLDDSFLANEALFDRFFLSTIPPSGSAPSGTTWPTQWTAFNSANSGMNLSDASILLPNPRIRPFMRDAAPPLTELRSPDTAAGHLFLDGAFNVNSTSIDAWMAFLGGLSGNQLRVFNATAGSTQTLDLGTGTNNFPFPRFWSGVSTTTANDPWGGLRVLDRAQLRTLATEIVEQVKLRGPFLSMADFLNRRLGAAGNLTRTGALQSAIDNTNLNSTANGLGIRLTAPTSGDPDYISANLVDGAGNDLLSSVGLPGYLMQQDIVQAASAAMSARSDTFLIRTYGETINPITGAPNGKAWLEAVVQRYPEYVDRSTASWLPPASNSDNERFGRRFHITSFRWLTAADL